VGRRSGQVDFELVSKCFLQTPAYDLKSLLALKLKRNILLTLSDKNFTFKDKTKQQQLLEKFKDHIIPVSDYQLSLAGHRMHKFSLCLSEGRGRVVWIKCARS
jgi:hypothetical protein